tara:strand:- start:4818 stop:5588 length:771 start_codon:yes stop_codon:yes gene_type:complete
MKYFDGYTDTDTSSQYEAQELLDQGPYVIAFRYGLARISDNFQGVIIGSFDPIVFINDDSSIVAPNSKLRVNGFWYLLSRPKVAPSNNGQPTDFGTGTNTEDYIINRFGQEEFARFFKLLRGKKDAFAPPYSPTIDMEESGNRYEVEYRGETTTQLGITKNAAHKVHQEFGEFLERLSIPKGTEPPPILERPLFKVWVDKEEKTIGGKVQVDDNGAPIIENKITFHPDKPKNWFGIFQQVDQTLLDAIKNQADVPF